ncbi:MAG TPA: ABC transporter substrate-binding protein [candidate division Zixibacteria bacterium]|nr:ABC transporter substrate-binding protein [candidate division Zixibacteria bacterium]
MTPNRSILRLLMIAVILVRPASATAGSAADRLRQSIDKILAVLADPSLKGEAQNQRRREKLRQIVYERFDFTEMAKRSLGPQWQKRTPDEQKEFVRLFSDLLESAYLDRIESYSGEKVRFVSERQESGFAEVKTRIVNPKGEELSLDYRLHEVGGDWKVSDVVIENISLVNNYRSQFSRVLARSSYEGLIQAMRQKKLSAPGTST